MENAKMSEKFNLCAVLLLLVFTRSLYLTVPLPFLTPEIVNNRQERTLVAGFLAGVYPVAGFLTSVFTIFVTSKPTSRKLIWWSGFVLYLSSVIFVKPIPDDFLFNVAVFSSR